MRRHDFDPISLVFGAIFTAAGLIFLFGNVDLDRVSTAWTWPIPLIVVGALIVLLAVGRSRGEPSRAATTAADGTDTTDVATGSDLGTGTDAAVAVEPDAPTTGTVNLPDEG